MLTILKIVINIHRIFLISDKIKRDIFQTVVVSLLNNGCITWTLKTRIEKKIDGSWTRMLIAILNKSWKQHPTRQQLYGPLPSISETIQVRRTRHAGHCWGIKDGLRRVVILWTPTHGSVGWPAKNLFYIYFVRTQDVVWKIGQVGMDRERELMKFVLAARSANIYIYIYIYKFLCLMTY